MTVVVGLIDSEQSVYIGGDSAGTTKLGDQSVYQNRKVFRPVLSPQFLIGVAGSFRLPQVLRYQFKAPRPPAVQELFQEYIATEFVDALRKCLKRAGLFDEFIGEGIDGQALVGYQGMLCKVQGNLQALFDIQPFVAIGAGEAYALGSLYSTQEGHAQERITTALLAATTYTVGVLPPFIVEKLPFDPSWKGARRNEKRRVQKR